MYVAPQIQPEPPPGERFALSASSSLVDRSSSRKEKKSFTASETAFYVHHIGNELADKLERGAKHLDGIAAAVALAKADCIRETESKENLYFSINQISSRTGETFDGFGSLSVALGNRLSPSYQAKQAQSRARKILKRYVEHGVCAVDFLLILRDDGSLKNFPPGVRVRNVVLTTPVLECSEETALAIIQRSLELLKKREIITSNVIGADFNIEFTSGKADAPRVYFHSHSILISREINSAQLANHWTDCYEKACLEFGVEFILPSSLESNRLNVFISDAVTYARKNGKSIEKAVFESCKYTVKGVDLMDFTAEQLVRIEAAISGKRLMESYGIFNSRKGSINRDKPTETPTVHNGTQLTADSVNQLRQPMIAEGVQMILEGKRDQWLLKLRKREAARRESRIRQLVERNPEAIFFTLDGKRFSSSDFVYPDKPKARWIVR